MRYWHLLIPEQTGTSEFRLTPTFLNLTFTCKIFLTKKFSLFELQKTGAWLRSSHLCCLQWKKQICILSYSSFSSKRQKSVISFRHPEFDFFVILGRRVGNVLEYKMFQSSVVLFLLENSEHQIQLATHTQLFHQ